MDSKDANKDKENIQNTIRALQEKSQHIERLLEKGNDVIIFQFGSNSVKFGFANQMSPQTVPTILGYYHQNPPKKRQDIDVSLLEKADEYIPDLEDRLRKKGNLKADAKSSTTYSKSRQKNRLEITPGLSQAQIDKLDPSQVYFEDEVFLHESNPNFIVRRPIKNGLFNISENYSFDSIAFDIGHLIDYIVTEKMEIDRREIPSFSIMLVIPDLFHRGQIKAIINIFMKKMAFQKIYLHQESVLASFGTCLSQTCVVDIGSDKINICCVDEGIIIPQTIVRKYFGGRDVDLFLYRLLTRKNNISYMSKNVKLDLNIAGDLQQVATVKEVATSYIPLEQLGHDMYEGVLLRDKPETLLVSYSDAFIVAPSVLFNAEILNACKQRDQNNEVYFRFDSEYFDSYFDPEDYYEESGQAIAYGAIISTQQEKQGDQMEIEATQKDTNGKKKLTLDETNEIMDPFIMQDLDHLICFSINQISDPELRKKMANAVLICGGGCQVLHTVEEFEDRLIETISHYDPTIERVEVINSLAKEIPAEAVSWVGATVMQKLDSMKEFWIPRAKWLGEVEKEEDMDDERKMKRERGFENCGVKLLREKLPFYW